MYNRHFSLPSGQISFFLFGPRQTGKSTLLDNLLKENNTLKIDLLDNTTALRYKTKPELFKSELKTFIKENKKPNIFIDEVQKIPELLDMVHLIMHKHKQARFILSGSSARKLKRGGANMLGGRAIEYHLYPLTFLELNDQFQLQKVLTRGSLPAIYDLESSIVSDVLYSYITTYLKEEIIDEAIVRQIAPFNRFLELAADHNGQLINYANIASDVGISSKTIQAYFQILEDTLICYRVLPYIRGARKRLKKQSKYYFFDIGISNALCKNNLHESLPGSILYGRQFEHFIFLEILRLAHYYKIPVSIYHWRDSNDNEVDFVIETTKGLMAIEVKSKEIVNKKDLKGLTRFGKDYPHAQMFCVSRSPQKYKIETINVVPWKTFFNDYLLKY